MHESLLSRSLSFSASAFILVVYILFISIIPASAVGQTVAVPTQTTLAVWPPTPVDPGTLTTLTATVTDSSGAPLVHGLVKFCSVDVAYCDGATVLSVVPVISSGASQGTATLRLRLGAGEHRFKAIFVGTSGYLTSSSAVADSNVNPGAALPSGAKLTLTGTSGIYDLTGTVWVQSTLSPTGSLSFKDATNKDYELATEPLEQAQYGLRGPSPALFAGGTEARIVSTADFNNDGIPDLVVVSPTDNTVSILLGDGTGGFVPAPESPISVQQPTTISTADFNADGNQDLAISTFKQYIFLGDGNGRFTAATGSPILAFGTIKGTADFNRDGILDLLVSNGPDVSVLSGNGDGTFSSTSLPSLPVTPISVADVNGDGNADMIALDSDYASIRVFLGDGEGGFTPVPGSSYQTNGDSWFASADFNQDGITDLAVLRLIDCNMTVLLGDGSGGFTVDPKTPFYAGYGAFGMITGDFNRDGKPDLATPNLSDGTISLFLGDGSGGFAHAAGSPYPVYPTLDPIALGTADLNGDGLVDLVATDALSNNVGVFLATMSATATAPEVSVIGSGEHQLIASYSGDSNFSASISATVPAPAVQVSTISNLTFTPGSGLVYGSDLTLQAAVSPASHGSYVAGGSLTFFEYMEGSYVNICNTVAVDASGGASCVVHKPTAGTHYFRAEYSGDVNFAPSRCYNDMVVLRATPVLTWPTPADITYGTALSSAQLNATTSVPGTFTYTPAAGAIPGAGSRTLSVTFTPTNRTDYTATTATVMLTVNKANPAAAVQTSAAAVFLTSAVTLTAKVTSTTSGKPTGAVTFMDGTTSLGSATLDNTGNANLTLSTLTRGIHSLTAVYGGDANFNGVTSAALSQTVQDFQLNVAGGTGTILSATVRPGEVAMYLLQLSPTDGTTFPAAMTLTVSGLPAGATYTVTPATLAAGSGAQRVIVAVQAPKTSAVLHRARIGASLLAFGLLPFGMVVVRTRKRRIVTSMTLLCVLAVLGASACGGGSSSSRTYTLQLTATSGALQHSTALNLTIR